MKIVIISTSDLDGGAARAAYRQHEALRQSGVESYMLVLEKQSADQAVIGPSSKRTKFSAFLYTRLDDILTNRFKTDKYTRFSVACTSSNLLEKIKEINPDVVNLHWVNKGFVSIEKLKKINKPLVWSLHDMWAFTGGCHYDEDCKKYLNHCGACPILNSGKEKDLSRWVFNRKQKVYKKIENLTIVPSSRWLAECAEKSSLLKDKRIDVIPTGVDISLYKPVSKVYAREIFNLPPHKPLIMFGSMGAKIDKRKGYTHLIEALQVLKQYELDFEIVIFGSSRQDDEIYQGIRIHSVGSLKDEVSLAILYSAADVMVVPSRQENLGNVIIESLSCGTPVAAFNIGGNADMIDHRQNGYLAAAFDPADLAYGIKWILENNNEQQKLSVNARNKITENHNYDSVANQYLQLFKEVSMTNGNS